MSFEKIQPNFLLPFISNTSRIIGELTFKYPAVNDKLYKTSAVFNLVTKSLGVKNLRVSLGFGKINEKLFRACVVLEFKTNTNLSNLQLISQKRKGKDYYICTLDAISSFNPNDSEEIMFDKPCMIPKQPEELKFTKSWLSLVIDLAKKCGCTLLELEDGATVRVKKQDDTYIRGSLSMRTLLETGLTFYEKYGFELYDEHDHIKAAKLLYKKPLSELKPQNFNDTEKITFIEIRKLIGQSLNETSTIQEAFKKLRSTKNELLLHDFVSLVFDQLCPQFLNTKIRTFLFVDLTKQTPFFEGDFCAIRSFNETTNYDFLKEADLNTFDVVYGAL